MARPQIARNNETCVDCLAQCEEVPASYVLPNGDAVCDTHLDVRAEND